MAYPPNIYERAFEELSGRRARARGIHAKRRAEVKEKLPLLDQLEEELASTSISISRAILSGEDVAHKLDKLRESNLYIQRARMKSLEAAGFSPDYLDIPYTCKKCSDTGFDGDRQCTCLAALLKQAVYEQLRERTPIDNCRFENFSLLYYPMNHAPGVAMPMRDIMGQTLDYCKEYVKSFSPASPSLYFSGATGLGKTHLSLAIAREVIAKGYDVLYTPVQRLVTQLEREHFSRDTSTDTLDLALNCDLLILDDLGAEFVTSFSVSSLYNILDGRFTTGRPVIISSNFDPKDIETKYSQRLTSRLFGHCKVVPFVGSDIRMKKKT